MSALSSYVWPLIALALVIGLVTGAIGFRESQLASKDSLAPPTPRPPEYRRKRLICLASGFVLALVAAPIWSGPVGGADRFTATIERQAREALNYYEMPKITAHLHRGPLTRRLVLQGQADDWQRGELVRLFSQLPGVSGAQWTASPAGIPLVLEGAAASVLGFLSGLVLAYLIELRRRYNAQWKW